jgi:hypothetical protein
MDLRVNDDTIPKIINMKLQRQYVSKKSHGRKIRDRRQNWLPGSPYKSGSDKKAGS